MARPVGSKSQVTQMRENWCEVFSLMGGIQGLLAWGMENQTAFYKTYAKLAPKEIITEDKNRTHDQFVKWIQDQEEKEQIGTPLKLIEGGVKWEGNQRT